MRTQARRAEMTNRRDGRLFDATTFARLCRARDYVGACYRDRITLEKAAREAGVENIRFFTQKNLYARRILDRMGLRGLERDLEAMRQTGEFDRAQVLEGKVEQLRAIGDMA